MTDRQALTAVATVGVCVCQQVRKLYKGAKQDIYAELSAVEDALVRLNKAAKGTPIHKEQAAKLGDSLGMIFKQIAEV